MNLRPLFLVYRNYPWSLIAHKLRAYDAIILKDCLAPLQLLGPRTDRLWLARTKHLLWLASAWGSTVPSEDRKRTQAREGEWYFLTIAMTAKKDDRLLLRSWSLNEKSETPPMHLAWMLALRLLLPPVHHCPSSASDSRVSSHACAERFQGGLEVFGCGEGHYSDPFASCPNIQLFFCM
eukprot:scaffold2559_cov118-Cylindrotheca_fusiformis.AAC.3